MLQSWGGRVISTAVFVVLARTLAPDDFGLVALATVFVDLGVFLTQSGFHRAIVQRKDLTADHLDASFWASSALGVGLAVAVFAVAPPLSSALGEPGFAPLLQALSFGFVIIGVGVVPQAILHRRMAFRTFAVRQLVATAVAGLAAIALAVAGAGPWALVAQTLVSMAVSTVILWRAAAWRPRLRVSVAHLRELLGYGVKALVIDLTWFAQTRMDDLLIGAVLGPTALGYYVVAYRTYAILLEVITNSTSAVMFPVFARLQDDPERSRSAMFRLTQWAALIAFPAFAGLGVLAPDVLVAVFGPQWVTSVPVLRILCGVAMVVSVTFFVREITLAAGRATMELLRSLAEVAALAVAFAIGTIWGLVGVATGRLVVALAFWPVGIALLRRILAFPVRAYLRRYVEPFSAVVVMVGVLLVVRPVLPLPDGSLMALALCVPIGALAYAVTLLVVGRPVVTEVLALGGTRVPALARLAARLDRRRASGTTAVVSLDDAGST